MCHSLAVGSRNDLCANNVSGKRVQGCGLAEELATVAASFGFGDFVVVLGELAIEFIKVLDVDMDDAVLEFRLHNWSF